MKTILAGSVCCMLYVAYVWGRKCSSWKMSGGNCGRCNLTCLTTNYIHRMCLFSVYFVIFFAFFVFIFQFCLVYHWTFGNWNDIVCTYNNILLVYYSESDKWHQLNVTDRIDFLHCFHLLNRVVYSIHTHAWAKNIYKRNDGLLFAFILRNFTWTVLFSSLFISLNKSFFTHSHT